MRNFDSYTKIHDKSIKLNSPNNSKRIERASPCSNFILPHLFFLSPRKAIFNLPNPFQSARDIEQKDLLERLIVCIGRLFSPFCDPYTAWLFSIHNQFDRGNNQKTKFKLSIEIEPFHCHWPQRMGVLVSRCPWCSPFRLVAHEKKLSSSCVYFARVLLIRCRKSCCRYP